MAFVLIISSNMSKNYNLIRLCNQLSELQQEDTNIDGTCNKSEEQVISTSTLYFCKLLLKIFGDLIHTMHPYFPSEFPSTNEEIWQYYINNIAFMKSMSAGDLLKPLIAIWSKEDILHPNEENKSILTTNWDMIVILPKQYTTYSGLPLQNQSELIFLKTSETDSHLTRDLESRLSTKCYTEFNLSTKKPQRFFNSPEFFKGYSSAANADSRNIGWWTLCNAFNIIMKGSILSEELGAKSMSVLEPRIKAIFDSFGIAAEEELNIVQAVESSVISHNTSLNIPGILFQLKGGPKYVSDESNFIDLVRSSATFVDKSLFIKELLDDEGRKRLLIIRPRRWGKSLNMSMVKEFLSLEVNEEGKIKKRNCNYNLFAHGKYKDSNGAKKVMNKKLDISRVDGGSYLQYEGKFPVISITMRKATENDFIGNAPTYKSLRYAIAEAYMNHSYITTILTKYQNNETEPERKKAIQKEINRFNGYSRGDQSVDLGDSIFFLAILLNKYLKRRVYIMIDQYDSPLESLPKGSVAYLKAISILDDMFLNVFELSTYQDQSFLAKAILTGVFKIPLESLESGSSNFTTCSVLTNKFSRFFGFTESELNS